MSLSSEIMSLLIFVLDMFLLIHRISLHILKTLSLSVLRTAFFTFSYVFYSRLWSFSLLLAGNLFYFIVWNLPIYSSTDPELTKCWSYVFLGLGPHVMWHSNIIFFKFNIQLSQHHLLDTWSPPWLTTRYVFVLFYWAFLVECLWARLSAC